MQNRTGRSSERALILIDDEPIRKSFYHAVQKALRRLKNTKIQIADFESKDKPAFARWLRQEFKQELTETERLQRELEEVRRLARAVEAERMKQKCSYFDAYERVMFDKQSHDSEGSTSEEEILEESDETSSSDNTYERTYSTSRDSFSLQMTESKDFRAAAEKVREIYRKLVRLLHPDLCLHLDNWSKQLWLQTQEAFKQADLEQLETLLVMARLHVSQHSEDGPDKESSVSDLQSAIDYIKSEIGALNPQLKIFRKDPAWLFCKTKDKTRLHRKLAYEFDEILGDLATEIEQYSLFLDQCSTPRLRTYGRKRR